MIRNKYILFCVIIVCLCACNVPSSIREARQTVAQSDSMWRAGASYDDSLVLAQAYETLDRWQWFYADDYAHACYHYGKLLRAKDNPVEAMQVFLKATHSRTHDYHILGRIYNNVGDICHLAGDFELSYDMFEQSGNMYLRNGDTTLYCYCLNDMAYELAEQGKKEQTEALLSKIDSSTQDKDVLAKALETKILFLRNTAQYDSVINAVNYLQSQKRCMPTGFVLKASAFWHIGETDSALFYAKYVLDMPNAANQDKYNMLYIVLNGDSTLQTEEVKALSEQRADLEMLELVPQHKQHAVAVNLLRQDIGKTPRVKLVIYIIGLISCFIVASLIVYSRRVHRIKAQQEELLNDVKQQQTAHITFKRKEIEHACSAIRSERDWQKQMNWKDYDLLCAFVDKHFFFLAHNLKQKQVLNEKEVRLCILVLIGGFSDKQLADILCYGEKSIRGIKRYTAQKLGTSSAKLRNFLLNMLIGDVVN